MSDLEEHPHLIDWMLYGSVDRGKRRSRMKYRIMKGAGGYHVEYRRTWWPFWRIYYWHEGGGWMSIRDSLEEAKSKLRHLKTHGTGLPSPVVVHEE